MRTINAILVFLGTIMFSIAMADVPENGVPGDDLDHQGKIDVFQDHFEWVITKLIVFNDRLSADEIKHAVDDLLASIFEKDFSVAPRLFDYVLFLNPNSAADMLDHLDYRDPWPPSDYYDALRMKPHSFSSLSIPRAYFGLPAEKWDELVPDVLIDNGLSQEVVDDLKDMREHLEGASRFRVGRVEENAHDDLIMLGGEPSPEFAKEVHIYRARGKMLDFSLFTRRGVK